MYFYYGITNSTLENPGEEIELRMDQKSYVTPPSQNVEQTAVWDRHGYENRMAEDTNSSGNNWNGGTGYWNSANTIEPSWDDQRPTSTATGTMNKGSVTSGNGKRYSASASSKKGSSTSTDPAKSKARPSQSSKTSTTQAKSQAEPPTKAPPKKDGFGMFVEETQFPSWDD